MCVLGLCGKGVVAGGLSDLHIALLDSSSRPEGDFFFFQVAARFLCIQPSILQNSEFSNLNYSNY